MTEKKKDKKKLRQKQKQAQAQSVKVVVNLAGKKRKSAPRRPKAAEPEMRQFAPVISVLPPPQTNIALPPVREQKVENIGEKMMQKEAPKELAKDVAKERPPIFETPVPEVPITEPAITGLGELMSAIKPQQKEIRPSPMAGMQIANKDIGNITEPVSRGSLERIFETRQEAGLLDVPVKIGTDIRTGEPVEAKLIPASAAPKRGRPPKQK